jgi:4-amino-4-deoxy-L-arabinose transferase-like glycosyltransferase
LLAGFWTVTRHFRIPAHGGGDQNAYLVAGRNLAERFSTSLWPQDPDQFVGPMWVAGKGGRYVPKYPAGYPLMVAIVWKTTHLIGHDATAPGWVYQINPALMTLALLGIFLLTRQVAGSLGGILAILVVATSPVTLSLANNPNSHAPALCSAVWGIYLLFRWWHAGGLWRAALAGLLLGFAATVRYAEILLVLPLVLVVLFNLHKRPRAQLAVLIAAWALPILIQLAFNYATMARLTGYAATGESHAFTWDYFRQNWAMMLRQLNSVALFGFLPLGVLGLLILPAANWRHAVVLLAWLLPGIALYTSYYWAPVDQGTVHYLRFFLSIFPPIAIGAAWLMTRQSNGQLIPRIVALVFALAVGSYNLWNALPILQSEHRQAAAVAQAAEKLTKDANLPPGSIVYAPGEFLNHLQFAADYRLYPADKARPSAGPAFLIEPEIKSQPSTGRILLRWTEPPADSLPPAAWRLVEISPSAQKI